MKTTTLLILISASVFAQNGILKTTTKNTTFSSVTLVTIDSVALENFIKGYIDRNSVTSIHTLAQIDNAVANAASSNVTLGTLTASGLYSVTGTGSVVNSRQLYYKNLLINGAQTIRVLTTEIP